MDERMIRIRELADEASQYSKKKMATNVKQNIKHKDNNVKEPDESKGDSDKESFIGSDEESKEGSKGENTAQKIPTADFKEKVIKYVKIDDMIMKKKTMIKTVETKIQEKTQILMDEKNVLKEELNELVNQKKPYEQFILKYMTEAKENNINFKNGQIIKKTVEIKSPINDELVQKSILEGIAKNDIKGGEKLAQDIYKILETKREKIVKSKLMRKKK
jgi:hypothetical protein